MNWERKLLQEMMNVKEQNQIKKEVSKIKKRNEKFSTVGREKNKEKMKWLKLKQNKRTTTTLRHKRDKKSKICETIGYSKELDNNVPVYGNVKLDSNEIVCLSLGLKFNNLPVLDPKDIKLEGVLTHTKSR